MPVHYAASEAVLVLACLWSIRAFWRNGCRLASVGAALIGIAAALGTIRFGLNAHDQLETIHKLVSRAGGLIGAGLIASDLVRYFAPAGSRDMVGKLAVLVVGLCIAVALTWPVVAVAVVMAFTLVPILVVLLGAAAPVAGRLLATAAASLMLINILLVQRSPVLGPDISWHAYHLLIAVWLVAIAMILTWQQVGRGKQVAS